MIEPDEENVDYECSDYESLVATYVQLTKVMAAAEELFRESEPIDCQLMGEVAQSLFIYSSTFRNIVLKNSYGDEMERKADEARKSGC